MVSMNDLISIAIQIEANGYVFYDNLAKDQQNQKLKEFFTRLADQERVHQQFFKNLTERIEHSTSISSWIEDEVSGYLKSFAEVSIFPAMEKSKQELTFKQALDIAINVEKDSIIFYSELLKYISDEKKIIETIINEEKKHLIDLLTVNREEFG
ncbi:ferritin-like domain-containing protein [Thermotoga profunda]|uniref:ferritin-like domain-containing protein n=1 Tax=Thermotoga profunda TaxID=1508420 RepID=UPI00059709E6|nr:ferritin family protein [Thermotoga profunda]